MARRRKKSRAAASVKKKDDQSPMLVDKSLPALPPSAGGAPGSLAPLRDGSESLDTDTPTELSPRPRPTYARNDSSSRSSSQKPRERSPERTERTSNETASRDGLTLPTTTYRNNRHSAISQASDIVANAAEGDNFFIPLALDQSPAPTATPRSTSDTWTDTSKKAKENKAPERDFFGAKSNGRPQNELQTKSSSPHIGYQEKGRQPSAEETAQIKDSIRKAQAGGGKGGTTKASPLIGNDDTRVQHANSPTNITARNNQSTEKFRLGEVPKGKKSGTSTSNSTSDITAGESEEKVTPRSSQDDSPERPKAAIRTDSGSTKIPRKEIPSSTTVKIANPAATSNTIMSSMSSSSADTSPSTASSSEVTGLAPTVNGKTISGPMVQSPFADDLIPPSRAPNRPPQQLTDSYMAPRAPPVPPPATPSTAGSNSNHANGPPSPKLPRWSAGGDFTMEEDMARILGTDESSQSILRRVSNAVRHGRTNSEASMTARYPNHNRSASETTTRTAQSPRWPKTPIVEDPNGGARDISSPISLSSPLGDDPAMLRRQLRNSEQRIAELEKQFTNEKDLKSLNKKLLEKRKTVSVLDSQTEIMIRQLEVLAGYVEKAKHSKQPMNVADLEESAIKDFVQKIDHLKQTMSGAVEALYEERNGLLEEKNKITAERDRALVEFEQLSSKNAQLADMNNDLTHQIQERFKAQSGISIESPRPPVTGNGLGIYTHQNKDKSNLSVHLDDSSNRPSTSTTLFGSVNSYPHPMEQDPSLEPTTVHPTPHVVNIRKGQAKKFWKKGGQTVAKNVSKQLKGAFSSTPQERSPWAGQTGESIGLPYNMTVAPMESPGPLATGGGLPRSISSDPSRQGGFGLFKKSTMAKSASNNNFTAAEAPTTLFGSDLVERADYERRQIPSVVTRCIEEVELRGMDIEGIYRKTGGSGQVKIIQEGFDKTEDYDISDPGLDITAVTSVLKQYFRKLPVPLLTFDVYDRILESDCKSHKPAAWDGDTNLMSSY